MILETYQWHINCYLRSSHASLLSKCHRVPFVAFGENIQTPHRWRKTLTSSLPLPTFTSCSAHAPSDNQHPRIVTLNNTRGSHIPGIYTSNLISSHHTEAGPPNPVRIEAHFPDLTVGGLQPTKIQYFDTLLRLQVQCVGLRK